LQTFLLFGVLDMKKKTTQKNTYSYLPRPDTQDTINARSAAQNVDLTSPVNTMYGQMEKDITDDQFYEDALPEGAKEKIKYGRLFNLRQNKGAALGAATSQQEAMKTGNLMNLAGLTQQQLVQTGGTQTVSDPMGLITAIAQGAAGAASGAGSLGVT
jgi:hypothetical protein